MTQDLKFSIERSHFAELLDKLNAIVPAKDSTPILRNIKVDVYESRIRLTATDLEISLVCVSNRVITERTGTALIPVKRLFEIVKESNSEVITIDVEIGMAMIAGSMTNWSLKLSESTTFPALPDIAEIQLHKVSRSGLLNAINSVKGAMCTDNSRPNLGMLHISKNKILATDGARFQQALIECLEMNIPGKCVGDLVKILKAANVDEIDVGATWNHLVFRVSGDILIVSKLAMDFPEIEQSLLGPALKNTEVLSVSREALMATIRQVRINSDPDTAVITLHLAFDQLNVKGTDKFGNSCTSAIAVDFPYPELTLTLNHKYLMDMLSMMVNPICTFYLGRSDKTYRAPLLCKDAEAGTIGIVQQMRPDVLLSALLRSKV